LTQKNPEPVAIRPTSLYPPLLCVLALICCLVIADPMLRMGVDDDFSYMWMAKRLAETGHVIYNGWTEPMVGWQLYLGAFFIKLFGFSFTILRVSILLLAIPTIVLMHRLFLRFGLNEWNATLATLTISISPLFLPLSFSFMSDIPGLLLLVLCLYSCVRAIQASTDRAALSWLLFAGLTNAVGGTVRQVVWLGLLVIIPSAAWWMRRRRGMMITGALLGALGLIVSYAATNWLRAQPYAISDHILSQTHDRAKVVHTVMDLISEALAGCLLLLPVLIAFLVKFPWRNPRMRKQFVAVLILILLGVAAFVLRDGQFPWLAPFSENFLNVRGLWTVGVPGFRPEVFPMWARIGLTALTFAAVAALLVCLWNMPRLKDRQQDVPALPWGAVLTLIVPYLLVYLGLLTTREIIYERYVLPMMLVFLVLILRLYQQKLADKLPLLTIVVALAFAAYGIAVEHDLYAALRARVAAADELVAAGVSRDRFYAGYEYDGWTQMDITGYLNDNRVRLPANAYHPTPPQTAPAICQAWFADHTPSIHANYILTLDPTCYTPSNFAPIPYFTWLAPHQHTIYVQNFP
jgi:Dolichyl-phosphate-mannose-protein mannosyltransferase